MSSAPLNLGAFRPDFWSHVKYAKQSLSKHEPTEGSTNSGRSCGSVPHGVFCNDGIFDIHRSEGSDSNRLRIVNFPNTGGGGRSRYRFGNWRRSRYGGLSFFIEERRKHYEKINNRVLKQLRDIRLGSVNLGLNDRLRKYRLSVSLPDSDYLYEKACLHVEREDASAGKALRTLRRFVITHNQSVNSAQSEIMEQVKNEFARHQLTYDLPEGVLNNPLWDNILEILFSVWQANDGELVKSREQARLLDYFTSLYAWNYENDHLWLVKGVGESSTTSRPVWRGSEDGKKNAMDSIMAVLVDSTILVVLSELEDSISALRESVGQVRKAATRVSEAIEADDYTTTAKCCPTILGLTWDYLIGG